MEAINLTAEQKKLKEEIQSIQAQLACKTHFFQLSLKKFNKGDKVLLQEKGKTEKVEKFLIYELVTSYPECETYYSLSDNPNATTYSDEAQVFSAENYNIELCK